jgi:hypothetical protein
MRSSFVAVLFVAGVLAGCGDRAPSLAILDPLGPPSSEGPVLGPDGRCESAMAPAVALMIEPGITECELVRLKAAPPTDVLIGQSGTGQREVQVLYSEPGRRELYLFVDNRLSKIVRSPS